MDPLTQHNVETRILVVDDYAPWRQHICSVLETRPDLHVVAQVADGLEAVQKAQELKPDLILLDIGLPNLNGIDAANRIGQVAPDARIIFVTENRDKDVVQTALSNGAKGYVLKTDVGNEFHTAVSTVLGGDKFVSSGIKWNDCGENGRLWRHGGDAPAGQMNTPSLIAS